jgi:hypothetical protein
MKFLTYESISGVNKGKAKYFLKHNIGNQNVPHFITPTIVDRIILYVRLIGYCDTMFRILY